MQNTIITKVFISDSGKDGKKFIAKNGKPYWKVGIKTDRTGDQWYSTIVFREDDPAKLLKEGDERVLILEKNGEYFNFRVPTKIDILDSKLTELYQKVRNLEQLATAAGWSMNKPDARLPKVEEAEDDGLDNINPDDIWPDAK